MFSAAFLGTGERLLKNHYSNNCLKFWTGNNVMSEFCSVVFFQADFLSLGPEVINHKVLMNRAALLFSGTCNHSEM